MIYAGPGALGRGGDGGTATSEGKGACHTQEICSADPLGCLFVVFANFHGATMNFYREAAKVLDDLGTKKHGSLKSLIFDAKAQRTPTQQKRLYALLSETLKSRPPEVVRGSPVEKEVLEKVIESSQLLKIERKVF